MDNRLEILNTQKEIARQNRVIFVGRTTHFRSFFLSYPLGNQYESNYEDDNRPNKND